MMRWEAAAAPLAGRKAVQDHKAWTYLFDWLGIESVATIEPKPGVPPSAGHLAQLKRELAAEPGDFVLLASYSDPRPSRWLEENTGIPMVQLPYTVGGTPAADDLFGLFEDTIARLLEAVGES
jgi:zinc/manganese transport system substrate-binding protein